MPGRVAGVTRWKTIDILLKTFEKAIQSIYDPHLPGGRNIESGKKKIGSPLSFQKRDQSRIRILSFMAKIKSSSSIRKKDSFKVFIPVRLWILEWSLFWKLTRF